MPEQSHTLPVQDSRNGSTARREERTSTAALLWKLASAYPNQTITAETINEYLEGLLGIPTDWIAEACVKARNESKWFPTVAEIRRYALEAKEAVEAVQITRDWIDTETPDPPQSAVPWRAFFGKDASDKTIDQWLVLIGRIARKAELPMYRNRKWDGRSNLTLCEQIDPDPQKRAVAQALKRIIQDRDLDGLIALAKEIGAEWIVD